MSVQKRKKAVKRRGSRTHGYGSHKKHRGGGSAGGKGRAGSKRHNKTYFLSRGIEPVGKKGFKSKSMTRQRTINLRELEKLAGAGNAVDLEALGYTKLLGSGEIGRPIEVKIMSFSKKAEEKLIAAGGKIVSG